MTHVKHLGFELELSVLKIVRALARVPEDERSEVVRHLRPVGLQRAIADQLNVDLAR